MSDQGDNIGDENARVLTELVERLRERDELALPETLPEQGEPKWSWLVRAINKIISMIRSQREIPLPDPPEPVVDDEALADEEETLPEMDVTPFQTTGAGVNVHEQAGAIGIVGEPSPGLDEQPLAEIEEGTGIVVMDEMVVGRIPQRLHSFTARFGISYTEPPGTPPWRAMGLVTHEHTDIPAGASMGVAMPCFGKLTGLSVQRANISLDDSQDIDLRAYNITTSDAADAPEITDIDTAESDQNLSDGLAISPNDKIRLDIRSGNDNAQMNVLVTATFTVEEQCAYVVTGTLVPDATGVYVRLGQYGGKPCYERIDGVYWIWWNSGLASWLITVAKGSGAPSWDGPVLVGDYTPAGDYTGTATVAARAD